MRHGDGLVHSGSLGSRECVQGVVGFHSGSLGSLGCALGFVGFIPGH